MAWAGALAAVTLAIALFVVGGTGDDTGDRGPGGSVAPSGTTDLVGEPLPDLPYERFDGTMGSLAADLAGRPAVINFWASYCVPCLEEMPAFEAVHQATGDQVRFLGLNVADAPEAARRMAEQTGVTYPLGWDRDGDLLLAFGVPALPITVFVDDRGVITEIDAQPLTEVELRGRVDELSAGDAR